MQDAAAQLAELRREIDAVDTQLVAALCRRFEITDRVRVLKARASLPRIDASREKDILTRVAAAVPSAHVDTATAVFERILGGSRGFIEVIARGIAIRGDAVLLCRAKGGSTTYLPGGHVEFGETARMALEREIREELGVGSKAGDFVGVVENSFVQQGRPHSEINLVYRLELDAGEVASQEEWIEFDWCPLARLEEAKLLPADMIGLVRR